MRYPKKGGYKSFFLKKSKHKYNSEVKSIDLNERKILLKDNSVFNYKKYIPITEICKMIKDVPIDVINLKLKFSSGFIISVGFNKKDIPKHLWFYIYDKDNPVARVYSPSIKSKNNVPNGCSSIQAEFFNYDDISKYDKDQLLDKVIDKISMDLFKLEDIKLKILGLKNMQM